MAIVVPSMDTVALVRITAEPVVNRHLALVHRPLYLQLALLLLLLLLLQTHQLLLVAPQCQVNHPAVQLQRRLAVLRLLSTLHLRLDLLHGLSAVELK